MDAELEERLMMLNGPSPFEAHLWGELSMARFVILACEHDGMHIEAERARSNYQAAVKMLADWHLPRNGAEITRTWLDWADQEAADSMAENATHEGRKAAYWRKCRDEALADAWPRIRYEIQLVANGMEVPVTFWVDPAKGEHP